jgi:predicted MFS family arabinose efflux permease
VCVLAAFVAMSFPENRIRPSLEERQDWTGTLAAGITETRRSRPVRAAVILVAVVASVWGALDEYTPLLIEAAGVRTADVALLMVVVWAGAAAGGLLAGRAARLDPRALAALVCGGAALMAGGAASGHPLGVIPLAAAFGVFQLATVVAMLACRRGLPARPARQSPRWPGCRRTWPP